jgi:hypothetical protein
MISKKELINFIAESQQEKVDKEIENDEQYKQLEKDLKNILSDLDLDWVFENDVSALLVKLQDLAYKKGLEDGLDLKELL